MKTTDFKSFHYLENGEVAFSALDTIKTDKKLESSCYILDYIGYPENRVTLKVNQENETSKVHSFPDKDKIDSLITSFFDTRTVKMVKSFEFNHKIGLLFCGKEGTGKSSIMKHYATRLIKEQNAIVFYINNIEHIKECWEFITKIRRVHVNPIVIIFDEIDAYFNSNSNEAILKTILDGNLSIDNCMFMASTNYEDQIPAAIRNRPSRFKYKLEIEGIQSASEVFDILNKMLSSVHTEKEIREFSEETKGSTLDVLKQFALDKIMNLTTYKEEKQAIGFRKNY